MTQSTKNSDKLIIAQKNLIKEMEEYEKKLENDIKELEQQNAELVAHCGEQRVFLNTVANFTQETDINEMRFRARELIHASPKQSLANQLREQAI